MLCLLWVFFPTGFFDPVTAGLTPRFGPLSPGALPYLPGRMVHNPSDLFRRLRRVSSYPAPASTLLAVFGHLPPPGPHQSCEVLGPVTRPATARSSTLNGRTLFFRLISRDRQGPVGPSDPGPDIPQGAILALRGKPSPVVLPITARPRQSF